jgi:hypothetical protein
MGAVLGFQNWRCWEDAHLGGEERNRGKGVKAEAALHQTKILESAPATDLAMRRIGSLKTYPRSSYCGGRTPRELAFELVHADPGDLLMQSQSLTGHLGRKEITLPTTWLRKPSE